METKTCPKCGIEKPATPEFFYRHKSKKYGLDNQCKDCQKEYEKTPKRKEKALKRKREYNQRPEVIKNRRLYNNKPEVKKRREKWGKEYYNRPETIKARKEHRQTPEVKARQKALHQSPEYKKYKRNYNKEFRRNNPEKVSIYNNNRRALEANAVGSFMAQDIKEMFIIQEGKCYYCKDVFVLNVNPKCLKGYHIEHKIPLSRTELNPTNNPENICLACPSCNNEKYTKTEEEFIKLLFNNIENKLKNKS